MSGVTGPEPIPLSFRWNHLQLAGSLHLPEGPAPYPAVLMAQGSGPSDRDSGGYFPPLRRALLDRGLAAFAFDKPGCGESSGDWRHHGLEGRAEQITVGLDHLRDHPSIDGDRVGLFGHSQGGWLTQMLAGRQLPLAFAVAGSAPTMTVREQILYDHRQTLGSKGHGDAAIAEALTLTQALQRAADEGEAFDTVASRLLAPASARPWYVDLGPIDNADDWHHFAVLVRDRFDPAGALSRVACPFLAVYGGQDRLLPAWESAHRTGEALAMAPCTDATIVVFPTTDHRIQDEATGHLVDGYPDLLGDWVARRTFGPARSRRD